MKVDTQTELEKTQLEIAKLQLEQERRKLAGMQRRSEAVGSLGRGVASTAAYVAILVAAALAGGVAGYLVMGAIAYAAYSEGCVAMYPGASTLYLIGCVYGQNHAPAVAAAGAGALFAAWNVFDGMRSKR